MVRRILLPVLVAVLMIAASACADDNGSPETITESGGTTSTVAAEVTLEDILRPADLEALSGLTSLKAVAKNEIPGAIGDVNIVDEAGQLVVTVVVEGPETWDAWLTDGYTVGEPAIPAVGDESFVGPNPDVSPVVSIFGFRKGAIAVLIETYNDAAGEVLLSSEQLRSAAEIVASRL